jgi:hypothetical protein
MKTPDPRPDWPASDLPEQGQEDLRRFKQFGGGTFDVEAGLAAFEERIASAQPAQALPPRSLLVGALVLSGLAAVAGFASLRTDVFAPAPSTLAPALVPSALAPAVVVEAAPEATTSIPSMSVDALPTVAPVQPRAIPVAVVASAHPASVKQADVADLIDAEVRHASTLRTVARTDPRAALSLAAEGDRLFPNGLLHAEREAIAIEALARLDRANEARTRADAFVNVYPTHPRAGRVRAISRGERPWEL